MFHGPVRDGKGWDHLAMVVKRNLLPGLEYCLCQPGPIGEEATCAALLGLGFDIESAPIARAHGEVCWVLNVEHRLMFLGLRCFAVLLLRWGG